MSLRIELKSPRTFGSKDSYPEGFLGELLTSADLDELTLAFRQLAEGGTQIDIVLSGCEPSFEERLRTTLIALEPSLDVSILLYDTVDLPSIPYALELVPDPVVLPSNKPIAFIMPLVDVLDGLFRQARITNTSVTYRAAFSRNRPDQATARKLVPALAELQQKAEDDVIDALKNSFDALKQGGWQVKELIGLESEQDCDWVENIVSSHFNKMYPFLPDLVPIQINQQVDSTLLEMIVAQQRSVDYLSKLFETILPCNYADFGVNPSTVLLRESPAKSESDPYVFISYAQADKEPIAKIITFLEEHGIGYWFDKQMETGIVWDEELEAKLFNCKAMIACVSETYQDRPYCRRELKYADIKNIPILPITFDSIIAWKEGLQLMFFELQITPLSQKEDYDKFLARVSTFVEQ